MENEKRKMINSDQSGRRYCIYLGESGECCYMEQKYGKVGGQNYKICDPGKCLGKLIQEISLNQPEPNRSGLDDLFNLAT